MYCFPLILALVCVQKHSCMSAPELQGMNTIADRQERNSRFPKFMRDMSQRQNSHYGTQAFCSSLSFLWLPKEGGKWTGKKRKKNPKPVTAFNL